MKKNVFYLMSVVLMLFTFAANMNAQVTIGSNEVPHPGAVLELRTSKGLLLPKASLLNSKSFQLSDVKVNEAIGMVVYNTKTDMVGGKGVGVYVWNGSEWTLMSMTGRYIPVSSFTIGVVGGGAATVSINGTLKFEVAEFQPNNASNPAVSWSVTAIDGKGDIDGNGLFIPKATGTVTVKATTVDGSNLSQTMTVTITSTPAPIVPGEGTVNGTNGNVYKTYTYAESTGLGTWMVENSKEGNPAFKVYTGKNVGERGYYYSQSEAASACPNGYRLPNSTEWKNLIAYINAASQTEKNYWLTGNALAGAFFGTTPTNDWDLVGYWKIDGSSSYVYTIKSSGRILGPNASSSDNNLPVRCIKK